MLVPETILQGRYRILRQLGQGGMGAVYEAIDTRLDATVALKETLFVEEKLRKQFEREARLLARLQHPALPRVSDHFAEAEGAFLVMQYIPGDDFAEMIARRRGPFPQEQVMHWADQLLDALDYLHTQDPQIIHRDIKPQNLKVSSRGQIILLDFGLAKGQVGELSRVTTAASIFGYTPNYAPLEQVQGMGTDPRSDIYALAATLYHLATGVKPPDALTRAAAIVNGQPDPLQSADELNPAVGSQLAAVMERGMAQNRDQRYSSAAEMRNALHTGGEATIGTGEAATVLYPSTRTQLGAANPTIANRATVPSGETTVVRAQELPPRKHMLPWVIAAAAVVLSITGVGAFYAYEHRNGSAVAQPSSPTPSPGLPAANPTATVVAEKPREDTAGTTKDQKAASASKDPKKDAKKTESGKAKGKSDDARDEDDARAEAKEEKAAKEKDKRTPTPPEPAEAPDYIEVPGPNGRVRRIPNVRNKTLPDGTKVLITPNGTRVVTFPDGTTKVFGPPRGRRGRPNP
jgi:eukaryotic-like serine/threonine-protein kinase